MHDHIEGIEYSGPGRPIKTPTCTVRWIGWDNRRGYGPTFTQYRFRCETHGTEWSGDATNCGGPKIESLVLRVLSVDT